MSVPPEFLNSLFIRKSFFAGHSLLVYDYLLTFSREVRISLSLSGMLCKNKRFKVEYVWGAPWTVVKATFLLNRYGNLIGQSVVSLEETGKLSHGSEEVFDMHLVYPCNLQNVVLVLMRAWTIWGCTYRLAVWLILLYVVYILVVMGMMTYAATGANLPGRDWCLYGTDGSSALGNEHHNVGGGGSYIYELLLLDTTMFATVMYSLRKFTRDSRHLYPSALLHLLVVQALSDVDGSHCFTGKYLQQLAYHRMLVSCCKQDPRNVLQAAISFPLLSVVGQRLVLNLRGFQTRLYTTRDLSREVNRQMAAMGGTSFWQADDQPNRVHDGGPRVQEWSGSCRATPNVDVELKDVLSSDGGARPSSLEGIHEVLRVDEECVYSRSYLQNDK
ncbi:hypothetical protein BU15DRAFT_66322 [Melanogaster broomeanus]|nr:hypothetical protein BU15DRAFT_66322 [Melanogaster broomeanus]